MRGRNYSTEDVAITRMYIDINPDPVVGAEQNQGKNLIIIYKSFKKRAV